MSVSISLFHCLQRHSREGGNPVDTRGSAEKSHIAADAALDWIPAFAGMTGWRIGTGHDRTLRDL
jgi:hypothetical protein